MSQIFINYRREDSSAYVHAIYQVLNKHFGKDEVFYDRETIRPGADFVEMMRSAAEGAAVLVTIIGKNWLSAQDAHGNRRLDNPNDPVRIEIASALHSEVTVIPVLVAGSTMPSGDELPDDLKPLARRNAVNLSDDAFDYGMRQIVSAVEDVIGTRQPPEEARVAEQTRPVAQRPVKMPASAQPSQPVQPGANIPNYLVWSIISTLCCCTITGIVAIIFSAKSNSAKSSGNLEEAKDSSDKARLWNIISLVAGVIVWTFLLIFYGIALFGELGAEDYYYY